MLRRVRANSRCLLYSNKIMSNRQPGRRDWIKTPSPLCHSKRLGMYWWSWMDPRCRRPRSRKWKFMVLHNCVPPQFMGPYEPIFKQFYFNGRPYAIRIWEDNVLCSTCNLKMQIIVILQNNYHYELAQLNNFKIFIGFVSRVMLSKTSPTLSFW